MRFIILIAFTLFVQEISARVRTFSSPDLKGLANVGLEIRKDGTERLVGLWKYERTHWVHGGIVVFDIVGNQLRKVWEDDNSLAFVQDFDSADINKDGRLDFVVSSGGYIEPNKDYHHFLALYLSDGQNQYRKQLIYNKRPDHVVLGDVEGDNQTDIVFTEQLEHDNPQVCWAKYEIKIGKWNNGNFQVRSTGIISKSSDSWARMVLGDIDHDGEAEILIYNHSSVAPHQQITIYNLNGETTPAWVIPRPQNRQYTPTILINKSGQILELEKGSITPTILDVHGAASKIAPIEIPEIDLADWNPAQVSGLTEPTTIILSQPKREGDLTRQITIYQNGD